MNVLFAAPEDAWGGILHRFRTALPEVTFTAGGLNPNNLAGYDVVIPTMSRIDAGLLQTADRLQLIQQIGAGLEGVDLEAARARGIAVANVPTDVSGNADSVAEMVIYFMLSLMRRTAEHPEQRQKKQLGVPVGRSLMGATVGIVGFGAIGQAVSRRLNGFGVRQIAIKREPDAALASEFGLDWLGRPDRLPALLKASDLVVLTLPDTDQTHQLFNAARFEQMNPGSYLINVGRGGLVERDALQAALVNGHLAGAALDVFWQEPPNPEDPIFALNLITSPHVAGLSDRSVDGIMQGAADNIRRLLAGEALLHRRV
ncbi:2-hydroxyacid dehydrogenase [Saccharospirillum alexandrii]|uniref:2-hydroxyacid dehydrogenase n=1 Tax=Saccharospirillum alexandrii TaxID=2448477 RepID=UPI000FDBE594|nr:2-hydroxyacid dehydrogenase [Saccharospirillum alexandrii]